MKNLNLIVNQNEISQDGNEYLTSGGYKSIQCNFSFSEDWNKLTKTAIFLYNGVAYNETLIDDKCFIPYEAIETKGSLLIGVFGTEITGENLEKRNTTGLLSVQIYEGSFISGIQPEKPSPETWELYLEEVNKLIKEATDKIDNFTAENVKFKDGETFQEKYDNGEFTGGDSPDNMKKSIYDINSNGIVDNAEKVNNHTVESDVPVNAIFTDTTYDLATNSNNGLMSFEDKTKIDAIEENAQKNVIESVKINGSIQSINEKSINLKVAELDENGKVLSSQLPSYVDDVIEGTLATFPTFGESGKIYVDIETNLSYRWTGSDYTVISPSIALGETSSTAYRGDRGKIAYEHSQITHAPVNAQENIIENIKLDGINLPIENKEIDIKLEDNLVYVGSTEPTGENRKKIWIKKGKNLINLKQKENGHISLENGLIDGYGNWYYFSLKVQSNTSYTFQINPTSTISYEIAYYDENNSFISGDWGDFNSNTKFRTITTPENCKNVKVAWSEDNGYNALMFSQSNTEKDYEEYIDKKIYVKNYNGVYEEFINADEVKNDYSLAERRIGTWIDGKPLYRKVLKGTTPSDSNTASIFSVDSNINIINFYGHIYSAPYNQKMPINYFFSTNNYIVTYFEGGYMKMTVTDGLYQNCSTNIFIEYTKTTD